MVGHCRLESRVEKKRESRMLASKVTWVLVGNNIFVNVIIIAITIGIFFNIVITPAPA